MRLTMDCPLPGTNPSGTSSLAAIWQGTVSTYWLNCPHKFGPRYPARRSIPSCKHQTGRIRRLASVAGVST